MKWQSYHPQMNACRRTKPSTHSFGSSCRNLPTHSVLGYPPAFSSFDRTRRKHSNRSKLSPASETSLRFRSFPSSAPRGLCTTAPTTFNIRTTLTFTHGSTMRATSTSFATHLPRCRCTKFVFFASRHHPFYLLWNSIISMWIPRFSTLSYSDGGFGTARSDHNGPTALYFGP